MLGFLGKRILYTLVLLVAASIVSFLIIQLPPGDYLDSLIAQLEAQGEKMDQARVDSLKRQYGLDQPIYAQYWLWVSGLPRGDFGFSFEWNRPVGELIGERIGYSVALSLIALIVTYSVAIPIGIYSATHQYSWGDYAFSVLGFIGIAAPHFMMALVFMFVAFKYLGISPGGLFSPEYLDKPWSSAKLLNMLSHIPVPIIIIGLGGTAGTIRVMRANLLDEIRKPYVMTARSKGLLERKLLLKYPVRFALNPMISTIGWVFPAIVSGETITGIVLNLPTVGPMLLRALLNQDMYLAGSLIMFLAFLTVLGMLISDILLAWLDPRIRFE
jgi:peptide/nickel transport system permease protein